MQLSQAPIVCRAAGHGVRGGADRQEMSLERRQVKGVCWRGVGRHAWWRRSVSSSTAPGPVGVTGQGPLRLEGEVKRGTRGVRQDAEGKSEGRGELGCRGLCWPAKDFELYS